MDTTPLLLITGAQGGVGQALSAAASARGWRIARVSRRLPAMPARDATAIDIAADVSSPEGCAAAFAAVVEHFGQGPDRVACAAGAVRLGSLERTTIDAWRTTLTANLDTAFFTLQQATQNAPAAPLQALLYSSVAAQMGTTGHVAVAAAKGAVEGMVRAIAADWAAKGWRINALALGMTETPMTESFTRHERGRQAVSAQYPLVGLGRAEEVAAWSLQLLDSPWTTGQIINLDGGFCAVRPLVRPA